MFHLFALGERILSSHFPFTLVTILLWQILCSRLLLLFVEDAVRATVPFRILCHTPFSLPLVVYMTNKWGALTANNKRKWKLFHWWIKQLQAYTLIYVGFASPNIMIYELLKHLLSYAVLCSYYFAYSLSIMCVCVFVCACVFTVQKRDDGRKIQPIDWRCIYF